MQPVTASVEKNQFPSAFGLAELAGICVGREIDDGFADQGSAIGGNQQRVSKYDQGGQMQKLSNRFQGRVRLRFEGSMQIKMRGIGCPAETFVILRALGG